VVNPHHLISPSCWLNRLFWPGLAALLLTGCVHHPISARQVSYQTAFEQANVNALNSGEYSGETRLVLHRFDFEQQFQDEPAKTLQELHQKACADERRDLLFALAELCYLHGEHLRRDRDLKPWIPKPAEDYFLCSAIYACLYLFGPGKEPPPSPFDSEFHPACSLYNRALARGFGLLNDTNGMVVLASGTRALPPGSIKISLGESTFPWKLEEFDHFLAADQFVVEGLSVHNKQGGLGATLIGIGKPGEAAQLARRVPATMILRVTGGISEWTAGKATALVELYSGYDPRDLEFAGERVPLRRDTTVPLAHLLDETWLWRVGRAQFFSAEQIIKSDVYSMQPYQPGRVPVVFIHGTFSSPIWWFEMINNLRADPVLSAHFQFLCYIYNSGDPILYSSSHLRDSLTNLLYRFDPQGRDPALQQMVLIGHSQGGLLAKAMVVESGPESWKLLSDRPIDELKLSPKDKAQLEHAVFFKPLPFVKRVVFISTPHRGSVLATAFVRKLAARFMSLPGDAIHLRKTVEKAVGRGSESEVGIYRSSLDGMSPHNKALLAFAETPPAAPVIAHSIIAVKGQGDPTKGSDGVVRYSSAHVSYAQSEFIVRSSHSCQDKPATIEEVRRILLEHLRSLPQSLRAKEISAN
jgi:pimeloyl-ACP methyl ester carboxylesterase